MMNPLNQPPIAEQPHGFNSSNYYLKRSLIKLVGAEFFIYDNTNAQLVVFVHQQGFKLRENIRAYSDQTKSRELFNIQARKIIDFSSAYDVFDSATGARIGVLKRKGMKSIIRDEWVVCDANEVDVATVIEDNIGAAIFRRLVSNLVPQNYDMLIGGQRVVDLKQNFNPFNYHLNIIIDRPGAVDSRIVMATAIMLAAVEGRQM